MLLAHLLGTKIKPTFQYYRHHYQWSYACQIISSCLRIKLGILRLLHSWAQVQIKGWVNSKAELSLYTEDFFGKSFYF